MGRIFGKRKSRFPVTKQRESEKEKKKAHHFPDCSEPHSCLHLDKNLFHAP
jgi:hypothetical protein